MSAISLNLARVSDLQQATLASDAIDDTQSQLQTVEQELSTGKAINQVSDNPEASAVILQLQKTSDLQTQYSSNVSTASSQLGDMDTTLGSINTLLTQAQSQASAAVNSDITQTQRSADAQVVSSLQTQLLELANTTLNGNSLFGGDLNTDRVFVNTSQGVKFRGTTQLLNNAWDQNTTGTFQVSATSVFGALSSSVNGTANLTPNLESDTRISDLSGASHTGVQLGVVSISDGTVTKQVDLTNADTVGDVVADINAAGIGNITASINGTGLKLSGSAGENITVSDVGSDGTAENLGIATPTGGAGTGNPVIGTSVNAKVTVLTKLSDLNAGAGLDTSGLTITNGTITSQISFSSDQTVGDLLNGINNSNVDVRATINGSGTGIDIANPIQGTTLSIGENGGDTATELGIRTYSPSTPLSDLNSGAGITLATSGNDFTITRQDGTSFGVNISGATTVQDVIDDINTAGAGGGVTASFASNGNGIVLTDSTGGSGALSIADANGSNAVESLGLNVAASGNTITGSDANTVSSEGMFSHLSQLVSAMETGNQTAITAAAQALQTDQNQLNSVQGTVAAQEQDLQNRATTLSSESTATTTLISNLQDANYAQVATQFQTLQTSLQANLEMTARSMQINLLDFLS